jgi:hypothetical protein
MISILILKFLGVFVNTGIIGPKLVSVCPKTSAHFFLISQTRLDQNKTWIINIKYLLIYKKKCASFIDLTIVMIIIFKKYSSKISLNIGLSIDLL